MNDAEVLIKFKGDTESVDQAQKKVEDNFKSLQKKGETAFLGLTAAADAFAVSIVKSGIQYNAEIETYLTRLTTLTGSAEEANAVLEQIKKDALTTPFEVKSLTQAESLLLSTGISAEQARDDILALGDAISATGGGNDELMRMAVNMQQIKNVGKASALDLKQFAYAGVDINGLIADAYSITREEASDLDITYEMLSKALQKANKKGGKYYQAMEKQSKTYAGSMSNLKEAIQVFNAELSEGLFNSFKKIIPELNKFFNWLTKNKEVILAIAKPTLAFINTLAGFIIVQKVTGYFKAFFTMLSAHPYALAVAGIVALTTALVTMTQTETESYKAHKKEMEGLQAVSDEIDSQISSWEGLKDAKQKQIDASMTELSHEQSLYEELKKITDENGRIKEGYEDRASFIVDELSNAFGVEIKMQDGVIQNYQQMQQEIEKLMEEKKAQILLNASEELYTEAIKEQLNAQKKLNNLDEKKSKIRKKLSKEEKKYAEDGKLETLMHVLSYQEEYEAAEKNYNKQADLVDQYYYEIGNYQKNYEYFKKGEYEKLSNLDWNYVKDYQSTGDAQKTQLEDQIATQEAALQRLKDAKAKSGSDIYDQQIKDGENTLSLLKSQLNQYQSATKGGLSNSTTEWNKALGQQLSKISGKKIEFRDAGKGLVQLYVDGMKVGKPVAQNEANIIGNQVVANLSKYNDGYSAGQNTMAGFSNGMRDAQWGAYSTIRGIGNNVMNELRSQLGIHSPSTITKQMGIYLLEGFNLGIEKEEDKVLNNIEKFTDNVVEAMGFNKSLNGTISTSLNTIAPKGFNPFTGISNSMMGTMKNSSQKQIVNVYASFKQDNLGQMVRDIKTFSGGARNDYNYGVGA